MGLSQGVPRPGDGHDAPRPAGGGKPGETVGGGNLPDRVMTAGSSWWTEARFGLFLHWGLYSLAARHEWVKNRERLTDEHYQRYFDHFFPDLFDPERWAHTAKRAGMRYFVVTTKHHEGFCLWDSDLTDYKVTRTPWG